MKMKWITTRYFGTGCIIKQFVSCDGRLTMLAVFPGFGRQFVRPSSRIDFDFSLN
jgi:hypothetical protein